MLNGQPLALDTPFTAGDTQYPANWLRIASLEDKQAIGITEVSDPEPYDDRFYWGPDNLKDLDTLKADWISRINQIAYTLLSASDWMIIRKTEIGTEIPVEWAAYRAAVRATCIANCNSIAQAVDVETFAAAVNVLTWPGEPNAKRV